MLIWRSETLANRSWTLVGEAFPRNAGQLLSPAPAVQPHDQVVCADRERQRARGLQELRLRSQTRGTWTSWPLRTRRIALAAAARWARGPLGRAGVHVEKLNGAWTYGLNDTSRTSPPESLDVQDRGGKYVVLLAGATCFGVPQPNGGKWSGNFPVGPADDR